jgi:hypothetical protein
MSTRGVQNGLVLLLTAASLGLWAYIYSHRPEMSLIVMYGAYYAMLALFFAWLYSAVSYLEAQQFSVPPFFKRYYPGLLFCLLVTLIIYGSVKPSFKTLPDELDLLSTSHSMVYRKTSVIDMKGAQFYGNFYPGMPSIDHRPFLYPFVTSLVHTLHGFDPDNAFLANAFIAFLFLSAVFLCTKQVFDWPISLSSVILVASIPIFSISATSGGMDLLSCFLFGLSLILLYTFLKNPGSELFALLWMTLLALGNARYEPIIFFCIFFGFLLALGYLKSQYFNDNRVLMAMTPLWLSLRVLERLINPQFVSDPSAKQLFQLSNLRHNFLEFLRSQINFQYTLPYNPLLNLFAFILLVYLFSGVVIQKRFFQKPEQRRFALILTLSILAQLMIMLSVGWGAYGDPSSARYFLPFSVACATVPFFWLVTLAPETVAKLSSPFLLGSLALFFLYHPIAVEGRFINLLPTSRETYFEHEVVRRRYPDKKIVVFVEEPDQFTSLEYGAADFATANSNIPRFLSGLEKHLYQDIVVIQRILYATQAVDPKDALDPAYPLETISEYETGPDSFIRISKVKEG